MPARTYNKLHCTHSHCTEHRAPHCTALHHPAPRPPPKSHPTRPDRVVVSFASAPFLLPFPTLSYLPPLLLPIQRAVLVDILAFVNLAQIRITASRCSVAHSILPSYSTLIFPSTTSTAAEPDRSLVGPRFPRPPPPSCCSLDPTRARKQLIDDVPVLLPFDYHRPRLACQFDLT